MCLLLGGLLLPLVPISAFSLMDSIGLECKAKGDCTVCDALMIVYNVGKFIFISMSGVALVLIVWGGVGLIMNWGSAEMITANKKLILHSLLGVVIILLAWTLVNAMIIFFAEKDDKGKPQIYKQEETKDQIGLWGGKWWQGPSCN